MVSASVPKSLIDPNPKLQSYYHSLESRIGYALLLGGTRHFGFYTHDTDSPFPITSALRRMEDKPVQSLNLESGAKVLNAGCGVGHVACHLVTKYGLRITGIDVVDRHIKAARRNVWEARLEKEVEVKKIDYHHLEELEAGSSDGVYTMEAFVHATDPAKVVARFYRILRPSGRIALFKYDHKLLGDKHKDLAKSIELINEHAK